MSVMERLEFDPEKIPLVKLVLHVIQILISFVIWCLEIAVFRADKASITGNNGWTFGVCFLSVPAWIYLVGAPRWPRTRRLANPRAMVAVDGVFVIIWLSAFATQAAYNSSGKCGDGCNISKAIVGLGVFECLFFVLTTLVSVYTLKYHQNNGRLPGYDNMRGGGGGAQNIDPDKAAFSLAPHDDEAYTRLDNDDHDHDHEGTNISSSTNDPYRLPTPSLGDPYAGSYAGATAPSSDLSGASGRPQSGYSVAGENPFHHDHNNPFASTSNLGTDTSYAGAGASDLSGASGHDYGLAPYTAAAGPAQFPAADYDRINRSVH